MVCTSQPFSCSFSATGSAIAQPTPPPTTQTFFNPSMGVGLPRGPTKSGIISPSLSMPSCFVVAPTSWKMMRTLPRSLSQPEMVSGMRSPSLSARRMMNCPGCALAAIRGASTSISVTVGFNTFFLRIRYMLSSPFMRGVFCLFYHMHNVFASCLHQSFIT